MPIDPRAVQWDDEPLDASKVKWDAAAPAKPKPKAARDYKRQPMTLREGLRLAPYGGLGAAALDYADAAQHHVGSAMEGLGQLIHKGVTGAAGLLPEGNGVRQWAEDIDRRGPSALANREAGYQRRVPTNAASVGGAITGEVAPWMLGVGELRTLGMLPEITATGAKGVAQKGGLLALEGGAIGGTQPVMEEGDYARQKSMQVGLGAVLNPAAVGASYGGAKGLQGLASLSRYLTPAGREAIADSRLDKLYGADPEALAKLQQGTPVEGFDLTPAQAIGTPEAVQIERGLRNNGLTAPAFAARESANNVAARNQVARIAGDDAAMEAAKQSRREVTSPWRQAMLPEEGSRLVDPTPIVAQLQKLSLSGNDTVRQAAKKHLGLLQEHMAQNGGKISATALDDIRQGVGSTLRSIPQHGAVTPQEVVKYGPVASSITDTLDTAVPGYRNHLATWARSSQPINDMEAARLLLAALDRGGLDAGGNQAVHLTKLESMLAKDNRADFPMSDAARKEIEAVLHVLKQRSITNNNVASAGPGTAADVQRAIQNSPLLMRVLNHTATLGGGIMFGPYGYLGGAAVAEGATAANNAVVRRMGTKAASAKATAAAIEAARARKAASTPLPWLEALLPYEQRALPPPR